MAACPRGDGLKGRNNLNQLHLRRHPDPGGLQANPTPLWLAGDCPECPAASAFRPIPVLQPFRKIPQMRSCPVEPGAVIAPGKNKIPLLFRRIGTPGNLSGACRADQRIADRASHQPEIRLNQAEGGELPDLGHHIFIRDENSQVPAATCELPVPGEKIAVFFAGQMEKVRVLFPVPRREAVCAEGIVPHETEIPAEGAQHPVHKKPGLGFRPGGY